MNFDPAALLKKSTSRAKSDVANKLVSMLLHELSRRANQGSGISVNSSVYARFAADFFGGKCPYCRDDLASKSVAVEHLEGMNRFRAGLHVPGNVIVSCSICNLEKRRDDQALQLILADSGWESFLSHGFGKCPVLCKTCHYWSRKFPDNEERRNRLIHARAEILRFQNDPLIAKAFAASLELRTAARKTLESFYREGQVFAKSRISELSEQIARECRTI
jgi:hypothetical protein